MKHTIIFRPPAISGSHTLQYPRNKQQEMLAAQQHQAQQQQQQNMVISDVVFFARFLKC